MNDRITYLCQGPRGLVGHARRDLAARMAALFKQRDAAHKNARAPLTAQLAELEREAKALAKRADDEPLGRTGCAEDLTALIEAIPDDGEVHAYRCPKCGNTGTARKIAPPLEA